MIESKPKILYAITKANFGGAQKYLYQLAYQAKNEGYGVVVVYGSDGLLEKKLSTANIKTIKISKLQRDINIFSDIHSFFELIKIFKKEQPDIIHLNSSKMGGVGALAAKIVGIKKIIFTIHGWAFNEPRNPISKLLIKISYLATFLLCHKIIAVSEAIKNQVTEIPLYKLFNKKIILIKTSIPSPLYLQKDEAKEALSRILKTNISEKTIIGGVSELHKIKGINYAIDAMAPVLKDHKNAIYIIIGEGEEKDNLNKQINKLGLSNQIKSVGFLADASKYMKAFDLFLFPSLSEAYGLVLIEAGFAGLPIIASKVGGISEIIEDNKTGVLIHPTNVTEITHSVNHLLNNKEIANTYAKNIKKEIVIKNNLLKFYKETFSLYLN